jgi:hypothetical protein
VQRSGTVTPEDMAAVAPWHSGEVGMSDSLKNKRAPEGALKLLLHKDQTYQLSAPPV